MPDDDKPDAAQRCAVTGGIAGKPSLVGGFPVTSVYAAPVDDPPSPSGDGDARELRRRIEELEAEGARPKAAAAELDADRFCHVVAGMLDELREELRTKRLRILQLEAGPLAALSARRAVGQHWLEVAAERMVAGEPEEDVMRDYGWVRG